jgi:predicted nuclease of restriction endonuclease-like (RecB) superfamily
MTQKKKEPTQSPKAQVTSGDLYLEIKNIIHKARHDAYKSINFAMVEAYWNIGRLIVEEEQQGQEKAVYGTYLIPKLAKKLTKDFGKGFDQSNLKRMRQFYLTFSNSATLWHQLSWSHYKLLIRVENENARNYYAQEATEQNWSVRAMERQINTFYYERILASRGEKNVISEAKQKTKQLKSKPEEFIKDPYVLEFLDLKPDWTYMEKEIEQALIDKLQQFLLELGKGFSFVARQKRISTETSHFYIDLVFYNYILKCFVFIDLQTGKLTHQDIGQMDMYVRLYEDRFKLDDDNPTIGIILCTEKDETIVRYSVLEENQNLFASKYKLYLPTEKELIEELEREKTLILRGRKEVQEKE